MVVVHLPRSLAAIVPGLPRVAELEAEDVAQLIAELDGRWPGIEDRLLEPGPQVRSHINVFVDGQMGTLSTSLAGASTVHIIPSIAGGSEMATRELLVELLRDFHARGWVSGTGGGICGPADGGGLLLAPTGVHKERIRPDEFFTVDPADGHVVRSPANAELRPSECNSIFCLTHQRRDVWSVVHSHALGAVLAGDLAADAGADHVAIRDLEMLKGLPGVTNQDVHLVPVIRNTPREPELVEQLTAVFDDPRFHASYAVLVQDHGAYIWGSDVWDAKRHTEVYHFLFDATVARRGRHKEEPA
jgi:methylthioribulose-1-phosphate dehydratase